MEVCHKNVWGRVCGGSNWRFTDAIVACRQLGLPISGATTLTLSSVPDVTHVTWLAHVRCCGNENSLFNCNVRPSEINCYRSGYAGVRCQDSKS